MSKAQRAEVDAMLRQPQPEGARSIEELRAGFRALMARMTVPDTIRTTRTTLGNRPALHVEPDNGPRAGTILYLHGGGFVFGSPETALSLTGHLVAKTGFGSYSPDYRLAPEHPFPAAVEDTLSAYRALLDSGTDPSTIAFAGDSAAAASPSPAASPPVTRASPARRHRGVLPGPRRHPHGREHGHQGRHRPDLHP